ncbi:transcriptional regulator [Lachnospiraceae bacterium JC7]|nr:transcriptional regulator [Lachnospiraceae bacterium JC7]
MSKDNNVTEYVMQYIKEKIESGAWPLDSKIPSENQLSVELKCSRTSIRSALQRYNVLGILESQHGRGSFVKSSEIYIPGDNDAPSKKPSRLVETEEAAHSYWEWRQARNILEPAIAARVAEKATDEFIQRINKINKEQRALVGDQEKFIEKDKEFHMAFAEFLGNRIIIKQMQELMNYKEMHVLGNDEFGYMGGVYFHALIADAVAHHDKERARQLMYEHGKNQEAVRRMMGVEDSTDGEQQT